MEIKRITKVVTYIEYDGIKFYKDNKGYWLSSRSSERKLKRLHIYVWEKYNGEVPKGYHVHHVDHDTNNNYIENLKLMERFEHLSYHANLQSKDVLRELLRTHALPKAIEWHKSKAGREWHKKHYQQNKDKFHKKVTIACLSCGIVLEVGQGGGGNKFCSNNCKSMYRRDKGLDDVTKECVICSSEYTANKYSKTSYCSSACRKKGADENRKNRTTTK